MSRASPISSVSDHVTERNGGRDTDDSGPRPVGLVLKFAPDDFIRLPLWYFRPHVVKAVIHERRRRFGVYDDDPA